MKVQNVSPTFEDAMKLHWATPNDMKIKDAELDIASPGTWGNLNLLCHNEPNTSPSPIKQKKRTAAYYNRECASYCVWLAA